MTPVESRDTVVDSNRSPCCNASQTAARLYACFKNIHTAYPGFPFTIEDVVRGISSEERTLHARDDAVNNEPAGAWLWTEQLAAHDMEMGSVEDIARKAGVDLSEHLDTTPMGRWGKLCQLVGPILLVTGVRENPLITLVPDNSENIDSQPPRVYRHRSRGLWQAVLPTDNDHPEGQTVLDKAGEITVANCDKPLVAGSISLKCRCGQTRRHGVHCTNSGAYKSRCPCLKAKKPCSWECRCHGCGNEAGKRPVSMVVPPSSRSKKMQSGRASSVCSSTQYVALNCGTDLQAKGSWMIIETLQVYACYTAIQSRPFSVPALNVHKLYDAALQCSHCRQVWLQAQCSTPRVKTVESIRRKLKRLMPCRDWTFLRQ